MVRILRFRRSQLKTFILITATAASVASLTSCASYFVRKDCEKTDWFEFGKGVAMGGNRLSGNARVRQCEEAESNINYTALDQGFKKGMADYCRPETVLATGRRGEFFSPDMCDGENLRVLKSQHAKGVEGYCQKSNGEAAGATGRAYNQICPKNLEDAFLAEFRKGRKKFLAASVLQTQHEVDDVEGQIGQLQNQKQSYVTQLATIGNGQVIRRETKYDPLTHSYREETSVQDDTDSKERRERITRDMRSVDYEIEDKRKEQQDLRRRIRELNAELLTL